jgi:hypothetical protein
MSATSLALSLSLDLRAREKKHNNGKISYWCNIYYLCLARERIRSKRRQYACNFRILMAWVRERERRGRKGGIEWEREEKGREEREKVVYAKKKEKEREKKTCPNWKLIKSCL